MAIQNCELCGKEFKAKPSANRKYCSRECCTITSKGKPQKTRVEKIEVKCVECGKIEMVLPSRADKYVCCSINCLSQYNSKRYSKKIKCTCPICNTNFELKPYTFNRVGSIPCCSKECSYKLKEITCLGKNNSQFGLKGNLNSSFQGLEIIRKNINLEDIKIYNPNRPDADANGRVSKHRLLVEENYTMYNRKYFDIIGDYRVLKTGIHVHHLNQDHSDNRVENLIPLTNSSHTTVHNKLKNLAQNKILEMIGVVKQGELLENLEVDNQQPILSSNALEGSETNSQIQTDNAEDSNANTSALLNNILDIIDDYIVRTAIITKEIAELEDKELLG